MVIVRQANAFIRAYKKLPPNRRADVDAAVQEIVLDPTIGVQKRGNLNGVFVHKFKSLGQLMLLAYEFDPTSRTLLLLGSHENFYRVLSNP